MFLFAYVSGDTFCMCWMHLHIVPTYPSCYLYAYNSLKLWITYCHKISRLIFLELQTVCAGCISILFQQIQVAISTCTWLTVLAYQRWYSYPYITLEIYTVCGKCIYILFQQILVSIYIHISFQSCKWLTDLPYHRWYSYMPTVLELETMCADCIYRQHILVVISMHVPF